MKRKAQRLSDNRQRKRPALVRQNAMTGNLAARKAMLNGPVSVPRRMDWNTPPEVKNVDVSNIQLIPGPTTAIGSQLINGIALGSGSSNRIGRKVSLLSYSYNLSLQLNTVSPAPPSTTWPDSYLRFVVVYDRQPNGVAPTWSQLYTDLGNAGTTNVTTYSNRNSDNIARFLVLESRGIYVPQITTDAASLFATSNTPMGQPSGSGGWCDPQSQWNPLAAQRMKKLNGLIMEFNLTSAAIGAIETGALWMIACHSSSVAGAFPLIFQASSRVRYIDF